MEVWKQEKKAGKKRQHRQPQSRPGSTGRLGLQALEVAIQHPRLLSASDSRTLCTLLQVSKHIRAILQQQQHCPAAGGGIAVVLAGTDTSPDAGIAQMASLAKWLPCHAGFLGSIKVNWHKKESCTIGEPCRGAVDALAHLQGALEQAAASNGGTCSTATSRVELQQQQHSPLMRLHSLSSNVKLGPALLAALPTAHLAHLDLEFCLYKYATLGTALSRLTNLKVLRLGGHVFSYGVPHQCIPAIGQLTQLTELHLHGLSTSKPDLTELPQSLVHLSIIGEGGWDHGPLSLSHLTRLERVKLEVEDSAQHGHSSLPGSLQELELQSGMPNEWIDRFGLTSLTGLRRLFLHNCSEHADALLSLSALTQLTDLALDYQSVEYDAVPAASLWQQLPALRSLQMTPDEDMCEDLSMEQLEELMQGIGAATQLTQLSLTCWVPRTEVQGDSKVFAHLTHLADLQELVVAGLGYLQPPAREWLHLTCLTALTRLDLGAGYKHVNDMVAVALACNLKQLQWLSLANCGLQTNAVLPALALLSSLRHIDLKGNSSEVRCEAGDFACLSALQHLTHIGWRNKSYHSISAGLDSRG